MEATSSPLTDEQQRRIRDAFRQPRRMIPIPHISVRRLTMRERVGRVQRAYPGISQAAAARLLRAQGAVVYEAQVSWVHRIPMREPTGELGGFLIPEDVQAGADRLLALTETHLVLGVPAHLLKPEGPQNAPAQRELLGLPVQVVDLGGVQ